MPSQNKSPFYFPFKGLVWKLMIDHHSSVLAVEWRDDDHREVNFSAIDLGSKKVLWDRLPVKEEWWSGLEEARYGKIILHGYKDKQNPEHQGIIVFDIQSGKYLWQNETLTFFALEEKYLLAYDPSLPERTYLKLDPANGNFLGELSEDELVKQFTQSGEETSFILNSTHYPEENKHLEKISAFIEAFAGKTASGGVDYLEYNQQIIVSFYVKEGEKLVNYLLVVSGEGEILLQEQMGTGIKGIGLDTFFLYKDLLIYVKNKKELVIFGF